jgi:hypothetical protein
MLTVTRRRFVALTFACGALLAAGTGARAMGIRNESKLLARSADGASALYELRGWGPEGGGSLAYRVTGPVRARPVEFLVSSTFSPGDGRQPQVVPIATCEQRLSALDQELARRGVHGVTVHPERCRARARAGVVTVDAPGRAGPG